ncbi:hypothetical protein M6D81_11365 [Paenibacillus sp. J5C_2022]|uniref:hypothetical protein n=1 Tax=Paenibacillus sp. J5C2022 TaxID=2977129 RepID=UPI0021CEE018|nr:hypothetical protein [Paenibacillus sp. J5C2022]MCU6709305.1 hypothetical protein [Paenibacillus sp. J5C2022]
MKEQSRNFIGKVYVSQHAIDRAVERFSIAPEKAEQWVRDNVKKARFVSVTVSAEDGGKESRLFVWQRVAYLLAMDMDRVITVYAQHHSLSSISGRVQTLLNRELTRAERKEAAAVRKAAIERAELAIERAKCDYRMTVTPSAAVIKANTKRIREIDRRMAEIDAEVLAVKKEKSAIARGLIAYI